MSMRSSETAPSSTLKPRKQVAALPVIFDRDDVLQVMLITSRETKRLVIPKGWRMRGRKDHRAAAIEARQEAGLVGRIHRKPVGSYSYWKRHSDRFDFCLVEVFLLEVTHRVADWREKGEREAAWYQADQAAALVDEPGLAAIIRDLPARLAQKRRRASKDSR